MKTMLLADQRARLDRIDRELLRLLSRRAAVIARIGGIKKRHGIAVLQRAQIARKLAFARRAASGLGLDPAFAARLFRLLIAESMRQERRG